MPESENIFLVGPMGAGKSALGRRLARRLHRPFWDSDQEIEQRTGVDVATIFEYEGEQGFRAREAAVLDELTAKQAIVLATGGGAVLLEQNRRRLKARGRVVYLTASVDTLLQRTARDRDRPLLQTPDRRARLETLLQQRDPLYRQLADHILDTDHYSVPAIMRRIVQLLK